MPHLQTRKPDAAQRKVVEVYHDFQRRMGFPAVPNFIKTHSVEITLSTRSDKDVVAMRFSNVPTFAGAVFVPFAPEARSRAS